MTLSDALLFSFLGIIVVFFALFLIMLMTKALAFGSINDQGKIKSDQIPNKEMAKGTSGEVNLFNTDPRDAAMIMAIVADEMKVPLNELRFISIKEVSK